MVALADRIAAACSAVVSVEPAAVREAVERDAVGATFGVGGSHVLFLGLENGSVVVLGDVNAALAWCDHDSRAQKAHLVILVLPKDSRGQELIAAPVEVGSGRSGVGATAGTLLDVLEAFSVAGGSVSQAFPKPIRDSARALAAALLDSSDDADLPGVDEAAVGGKIDLEALVRDCKKLAEHPRVRAQKLAARGLTAELRLWERVAATADVLTARAKDAERTAAPAQRARLRTAGRDVAALTNHARRAVQWLTPLHMAWSALTALAEQPEQGETAAGRVSQSIAEHVVAALNAASSELSRAARHCEASAPPVVLPPQRAFGAVLALESATVAAAAAALSRYQLLTADGKSFTACKDAVSSLHTLVSDRILSARTALDSHERAVDGSGTISTGSTGSADRAPLPPYQPKLSLSHQLKSRVAQIENIRSEHERATAVLSRAARDAMSVTAAYSRLTAVLAQSTGRHGITLAFDLAESGAERFRSAVRNFDDAVHDALRACSLDVEKQLRTARSVAARERLVLRFAPVLAAADTQLLALVLADVDALASTLDRDAGADADADASASARSHTARSSANTDAAALAGTPLAPSGTAARAAAALAHRASSVRERADRLVRALESALHQSLDAPELTRCREACDRAMNRARAAWAREVREAVAAFDPESPVLDRRAPPRPGCAAVVVRASRDERAVAAALRDHHVRLPEHVPAELVRSAAAAARALASAAAALAREPLAAAAVQREHAEVAAAVRTCQATPWRSDSAASHIKSLTAAAAALERAARTCGAAATSARAAALAVLRSVPSAVGGPGAASGAAHSALAAFPERLNDALQRVTNPVSRASLRSEIAALLTRGAAEVATSVAESAAAPVRVTVALAGGGSSPVRCVPSLAAARRIVLFRVAAAVSHVLSAARSARVPTALSRDAAAAAFAAVEAALRRAAATAAPLAAAAAEAAALSDAASHMKRDDGGDDGGDDDDDRGAGGALTHVGSTVERVAALARRVNEGRAAASAMAGAAVPLTDADATVATHAGVLCGCGIMMSVRGAWDGAAARVAALRGTVVAPAAVALARATARALAAAEDARSELEARGSDAAALVRATSAPARAERLRAAAAAAARAATALRAAERALAALGGGGKGAPESAIDVAAASAAAERLAGAADALAAAATRRWDEFQTNLPAVRAALGERAEALAERARRAVQAWRDADPAGAASDASAAGAAIVSARASLASLQRERDELAELGRVAGKTVAVHPGGVRLDAWAGEVDAADALWGALERIALGPLRDLRDTLWGALSATALRDRLDAILAAIDRATAASSEDDERAAPAESLPALVRDCGAARRVRERVAAARAACPLLASLRSPALRDRHWARLASLCGTPALATAGAARDAPLGVLWDARLARFRNEIADVVAAAEGERAVEAFLDQLRRHWSSAALGAAPLRGGRARVARGWDAALTSARDHLAALAAARASPHAAFFAEDVRTWEARLSAFAARAELWVEAQRRYVHLESVFRAPGGELEAQLPAEHARFGALERDFRAALDRLLAVASVLDIARDAVDAGAAGRAGGGAGGGADGGVPATEAALAALVDGFHGVQAALAKFLDAQRTRWPRLYFVNNDDLLDLLGGGGRPDTCGRHLPKLFAGVHALQTTDRGNTITAVVSAEGETLALGTAVDATPGGSGGGAVAWLAALESAVRDAVGAALRACLASAPSLRGEDGITRDALTAWVSAHQGQALAAVLHAQFTAAVEWALERRREAGDDARGALALVRARVDDVLAGLAGLARESSVDGALRRRCEALTLEAVHERSVLEHLDTVRAQSPSHIAWRQQLRGYMAPADGAGGRGVAYELAVGDAVFPYGYEFFGAPERLVQSALTDRSILALAQALHWRLGGAPRGPAGTGKTETVKFLGQLLGRMTLVFNCDEGFDGRAMTRILSGLCRTGAFGCFDEFNRLAEADMSAVSQDLEAIQSALRHDTRSVPLGGRRVPVERGVGVFVTMNPDYIGRQQLPENLRQLFRPVTMARPDNATIAEVVLAAQGFVHARDLAGSAVPLFERCRAELSDQAHYDFGLRALKAVLARAGTLMRRHHAAAASSDGAPETAGTDRSVEVRVLAAAFVLAVKPKLLARDAAVFGALLREAFPGCATGVSPTDSVRAAVETSRSALLLEGAAAFDNKTYELLEIVRAHHGVMLVGPPGSGKSAALATLRDAIGVLGGAPLREHRLDAKTLPKGALFGELDETTRDWTDGVFTALLRGIIEDTRAAAGGGADADADASAAALPLPQHWIVFDGDVDPTWIENLNSVLDDNRVLTLPNGERLALPDTVRLVFEVDSLQFATQATVSRVGMVWFGNDTVPVAAAVQRFAALLRRGGPTLAARVADVAPLASGRGSADAPATAPDFSAGATAVAAALERELDLVESVLDAAAALGDAHIMPFARGRVLGTLFSLLGAAAAEADDEASSGVEGGDGDRAVLDAFAAQRVVESLVWAAGGSLDDAARRQLAGRVAELCSTAAAAPRSGALVDAHAVWARGWVRWDAALRPAALSHEDVLRPDVVVETADTVRHRALVLQMLRASSRVVLLCGPPGSGKTLLLKEALAALPSAELLETTFASGTSVTALLALLESRCVYAQASDGLVLRPRRDGSELVVFCDELNLPAADAYGTARVLAFLRQVVLHDAFWHAERQRRVRLERVRFVAACNPPTDAGRHPLPPRLLRLVALLRVPLPGREALGRIYGALARGALQLAPQLRQRADALADAMVGVHAALAERFGDARAPHRVFSPRDLSRWLRAVYATLRGAVADGRDDTDALFLALAASHEGERVLVDRLPSETDRRAASALLRRAVHDAVGVAAPRDGVDALCDADGRAVLFAAWTRRSYGPTDANELRTYARARLRTFFDEELGTAELVLHDDALAHCVRIDRALRQPMEHLLLVSESGAGATVLTRFCAWHARCALHTIQPHPRYSLDDFDDDVRAACTDAGARRERTVLLFPSAAMENSAFLERINSLLTAGEVPGLFAGAARDELLALCRREGAERGETARSEEAAYASFVARVRENLHAVFVLNPRTVRLADSAAASPALFNRCVIDWVGAWSTAAMLQVATEVVRAAEVGPDAFVDGRPSLQHVLQHELVRDLLGSAIGDEVAERTGADGDAAREAIAAALVAVHATAAELFAAPAPSDSPRAVSEYAVTPAQLVALARAFVHGVSARRAALADRITHLRRGTEALATARAAVATMREELAEKRKELDAADAAARASLERIVDDERKAETSRGEALALRDEIEGRQGEVDERAARVREDLADGESAVASARSAVQGIRKPQLDEVRRLTAPPVGVRLAVEAVCACLGHDVKDWRATQRVLRRDDFIASILQFDGEAFARERSRITRVRKLASAPEFTYETVNHASKACGPLVQWVKAQVALADIVSSVAPLRAEVEELEGLQAALRERLGEKEREIAGATEHIAALKREYGEAVARTEAIKRDAEAVEKRLERADALPSSLADEAARWEAEAARAADDAAACAGEALAAAAAHVYGGVLGPAERADFARRVAAVTRACGMVTATHSDDDGERGGLGGFGAVELASEAERRAWCAAGLPGDAFSAASAAIALAAPRCAYAIDPLGTAAAFFARHLRDVQPVLTSARDAGFAKAVESAARFGLPLVVRDAEAADSSLLPLLSGATKSQGGRRLVRFHGRDIDLSPTFRLFLVSGVEGHVLPPQLASRVSVASFAPSRDALRARCLAATLRAAQPELHARRAALQAAQGGRAAQLRELEDRILDAVADAGAILNDDAAAETLEAARRDAAATRALQRDAAAAAAEADRAASEYAPVADVAADAVGATAALSRSESVYAFSTRAFLAACDMALASAAVRDQSAEEIAASVLRAVFRRFAPGIAARDRPAYAAALALVHTRHCHPSALPPALLRAWRAAASAAGDARADSALRAALEQAGAPADAARALGALAEGVGVQGAVQEELGAWVAALRGDAAALPQRWESALRARTARGVDVCRAALDSTARPERTRTVLAELAQAVLGEELDVYVPPAIEEVLAAAERERDVRCRSGDADEQPDEDEDAEEEAVAPIVLLTARGRDVTRELEELASSRGVTLCVAALGSAERNREAEAAVATAQRGGGWVLLANGHLAPHVLGALVKRLAPGSHAGAHRDARVFVAMEASVGAAVRSEAAPLLRVSHTVLFEAATGMRAGILRALRDVEAAAADMDDTLANASTTDSGASRVPAAAAFAALAGTLVYFHAAAEERGRFGRLGWARAPELAAGDVRASLAIVSAALERQLGASDAEHATTALKRLADEAGQFDDAAALVRTVREMVLQSVYVSKLDADADAAVCRSLGEWLIDGEAPQALVDRVGAITGTPLGSVLASASTGGASTRDLVARVRDWAEGLPAVGQPEWAGLVRGSAAAEAVREGAFIASRALALAEGGATESSATVRSGDAQGAAADDDKTSAPAKASRKSQDSTAETGGAVAEDALGRWLAREPQLDATTAIRQDGTVAVAASQVCAPAALFSAVRGRAAQALRCAPADVELVAAGEGTENPVLILFDAITECVALDSKSGRALRNNAVRSPVSALHLIGRKRDPALREGVVTLQVPVYPRSGPWQQAVDFVVFEINAESGSQNTVPPPQVLAPALLL